MLRITALLAGFLVTLSATLPAQTTWFVDASNPGCPGSGTQGDPFCAIQDAINASFTGDVILVLPGVYAENLVISGTSITLRSDADGDPATTDPEPGLVTLDGQLGVGILSNGAFPTDSSTIEGFTITHCSTGIVTNDTSDVIRGNHIHSNQSGLFLSLGFPTLQDNEIALNTTVGVQASVSLVTMEGNRVTGNACNAGFGGVLVIDSDVFLHGDRLVGNCNTALLVIQSDAEVDDCVFLDNSATDGGALFVSSSATADVDGCVFVNNTATNQGGAIHVDENRATIRHSIFRGNTAPVGPNAYVCGFGGSLLEWSDLEGGPASVVSCPGVLTLGPGNIDVDPMFTDPSNGDFTLQPGSPCIDAGDPAVAPTGLDAGGFPRFLDGDLDRIQVVDLGAHEFSNARLEVTGSPTPGAALTFATTGTPGLFVLLWVGTAPGEVALAPYGSLFFDPASFYDFLPFGVVPNNRVLTIPASLPVPATFIVQELAIDFPSRTGNTANPVELLIE